MILSIKHQTDNLVLSIYNQEIIKKYPSRHVSRAIIFNYQYHIPKYLSPAFFLVIYQ